MMTKKFRSGKILELQNAECAGKIYDNPRRRNSRLLRVCLGSIAAATSNVTMKAVATHSAIVVSMLMPNMAVTPYFC
jgi:hypothetical protein